MASLVLASACDTAPEPAAKPAKSDPTAAFFAPDHVIEVQLTVAPGDWDKIRQEGGNPAVQMTGACQKGPLKVNYTTVPAQVAIDGQKIAQIGLRKKGFLGSASVAKPSLKLKLNHVDAKASHLGLDRITLNNNKQDPSHLHTCLALQLFAKAGVPAPRCNFAHVTVNGKDLGVYTNIESVGEPFLLRTFGDATGNLYEGQMSDFRPGWTETYSLSSPSAKPDRSDLQVLTQALVANDAELLKQLAAILDVDAFVNYWTMEAVLAAWDSYSSTQNNHYVYHNPKDGKFHFVPWGPDMTFGSDDPMRLERPQSLSAWGAISHRLYQLPELQDKYRAQLLKNVDALMDPPTVLAEIDRMEKLIAPIADPTDGQFKAAVDEVRLFVQARQNRMHAELDAGPLPWKHTPPPSPCHHVLGHVSGTFSTTMGSTAKGNPFEAGKATVALALNGTAAAAVAGGAAAGRDNLHIQIQNVVLSAAGGRIAILFIDRSEVGPGRTVALDGQHAFGVVGQIDLAKGKFSMIGMMSNGTIKLEAADLTPNAPLTGSFDADLQWN